MDKNLDFENSDQIMKIIVGNGELPQFIYKYTDIKSLKLILENSTLKFSKPSEFNDPFDCNLTIDTNNSKEEIDTYISMIRISKNLNEKQVAELGRKYFDPDELFAITNKSIGEATESFGVTCFSKTHDNLVMWAHYADKHKGVCLKFDILADAEFFMTPFPVIYKKEYPIYNYIRNRDGLGKFLLETKSVDWKYENEIRVMKKGAGLYNFNKDSLCEVIFGANTPARDKETIEKMVGSLVYDKVRIKSARISKKKFRLKIK